jgi:DNA-binding transcriptional ArsR family regulator
MSLKGRFSVWESQANRTKIFLTLLDESMTFSELLEETGFSRSTLSTHLKALQKSGVIERAVQKEKIVYRTVLDTNKLVSEMSQINLGLFLLILEVVDSEYAKNFRSMLAKVTGKIIEVKVKSVGATLGISQEELYKHLTHKMEM